MSADPSQKKAAESLVHHRRQLLRVSRELTTEEVKQLLFICPIVSKSRAEKVQEGYQLFEILEEKGLLSPEKYNFLQECLQHIGRMDLVAMVRAEAANAT